MAVKVTCPNCHSSYDIQLVLPEAEARLPTAADILALFPDDLKPLLRVEDAGDKFIVKPTKWLGKERFNAAMVVVRQKGGEYIPAGKDSYFSIPKR